jgi:hypothetical protein
MPSDGALTMSTVVVAAEHQISCAVGDEAVLLNAHDGEYYGLNPVAASIWRKIEGPCALDRIRDELLAEYSGISATECERAVLDLVSELLALGVARIH